jgi:hypothetical protein
MVSSVLDKVRNYLGSRSWLLGGKRGGRGLLSRRALTHLESATNRRVEGMTRTFVSVANASWIGALVLEVRLWKP